MASVNQTLNQQLHLSNNPEGVDMTSQNLPHKVQTITEAAKAALDDVITEFIAYQEKTLQGWVEELAERSATCEWRNGSCPDCSIAQNKINRLRGVIPMRPHYRAVITRALDLYEPIPADMIRTKGANPGSVVALRRVLDQNDAPFSAGTDADAFKEMRTIMNNAMTAGYAKYVVPELEFEFDSLTERAPEGTPAG